MMAEDIKGWLEEAREVEAAAGEEAETNRETEE